MSDVAGGDTRTKLVTVHGTGAGHEHTNGERWWQLGSPFLNALGERLLLDPAKIEIVPFRWCEGTQAFGTHGYTGPNSEEARRYAGDRLYDKLRAYDDAGVAYHVIGHSHGGSVIYNALLKSLAKRKPFTGLKSWTTVGTPFLDYRPNRFLFQRLGVLGLTLFSTAVGALLFALGVLFMYHFGFGLTEGTTFWPMIREMLGPVAVSEFIGPVTLVLGIYAVVCIGFLIGVEQIRGDWHTKGRKKKVEATYGDRWIGLWHRDDEAISALTNVRQVSCDIIPSTFLVPLFASVPLLLTIGAVGALSLYFMFLPVQPKTWSAEEYTRCEQIRETQGELNLPADCREDEVFAFLQDMQQSVRAEGTLGMNTIEAISMLVSMILAATAIYIAVTFMLTWLLKKISTWIGWPLAKMMNAAVWSSIRQQAWGDDRLKEAVLTAGSQPPEFGTNFAPLPRPIADPLSEHSEKHAILTLAKVRKVLGMAGEPASSPSMLTELSENLNWQELIHTAYFDIPEFQDITAAGLYKAGLAEFNTGWDPAARQQAAGWLNEIAPAIAVTLP